MLVSLIDSLRKIVGDDFFLTGDELAPYLHTTTIEVKSFDSAVRPANVDELKKIVQIAGQYKTPLYPISTGKNWGYGTASPVRDGCILLDLSRMDKIIEVNNEFAYAIIEPGVTQEQLSQFLRSSNSGLRLNVTGSSPHCSVLGNILEKGWGVGPYGDHFEHTCGMEVVLANGEVLNTGFGHYPNAKGKNVYKWGIGPSLDGIFAQSANGIVSKICVWLFPEPEYSEVCSLIVYKESSMDYIVDTIRKLLLNNTLQGGIAFSHKNRVAALGKRYIPANHVAFNDKRNPEWRGAIFLHGTRESVNSNKKLIRKLLKKHAKIIFISNYKMSLLNKLAKTSLAGKFADLINIMNKSISVLSGIPNEFFLSLAYWRNAEKLFPEANVDPARDNCGLIWFSPVTALTFSHIKELREIVKPIFEEFGFEMFLGMTTIGERAFDCTIPILYNRNDPKEKAKAQDCYDRLAIECSAKGFIPYRVSIESMHHYIKSDDVFWQSVKKIKNSLDPDSIISPGRYTM